MTSRSKRRGFTLLELMVAAAVLVVSITALLASFVNSYLLNEASNNEAIAANDAQYVLELLKNMTYAEIGDDTYSDFTNLDNESIDITVSESGNVKEVVADVSWTERGRQRNLDVTTRFSW